MWENQQAGSLAPKLAKFRTNHQANHQGSRGFPKKCNILTLRGTVLPTTGLQKRDELVR